MKPRNDLRQALVGLHEQLPRCADLLNARSEEEAFRLASAARFEVEARLRELDSTRESADSD